MSGWLFRSIRPPPESLPAYYRLVTGGAGFLGAHLARRLLEAGHGVVLLDDLSARGSFGRARALRSRYGERVIVRVADVRDAATVAECVEGAAAVFHLAAPPPRQSSQGACETVARGLLQVLQALRQRSEPPPFLHVSSRRVYGHLAGLQLMERLTRWEPQDEELRRHGLSEALPLDLGGAWGLTQGLADRHVLEAARTEGLPCAVVRVSSVYGEGQQEGRGWLAQLLRCAQQRLPFALHGDGKQVHDLLHVEDAVEALLALADSLPRAAGEAFNLGGGPQRSLSVLEAATAVGKLAGRNLALVSQQGLPGTGGAGEARYWTTDTRKLQAATGWQPRVSLAEGLQALLAASHSRPRALAPAAGAPRRYRAVSGHHAAVTRRPR